MGSFSKSAAAGFAGVLAVAAITADVGCARATETAGHGSSASSPVSPSAGVHFVGRFDNSDPVGPRFAWSASGIRARFSGTAIDVRLKDTGQDEFQIVVDGVPTTVLRVTPARETYTLATGLPDGAHDIEIYKRTEPRVGQAQFLGFALTGGRALLPTPAQSTRKIELIGDPITAGYGAEGASATCHFSAGTENEYLTYGAIAARSVGAEHVTVAWSGKTTEGMAELYDRVLPAEQSSRWDFRAWVPDVVVVNLATNNFAGGDPGQTSFVAAYARLVDRVRAHYPAALIVCALGPMLADTYPPGAKNLTHARKYIRNVVDTKHAAGDTRVTFLEFPAQDFANGLGCDYHPNLKTHRLMADQLAGALRAQLGW